MRFAVYFFNKIFEWFLVVKVYEQIIMISKLYKNMVSIKGCNIEILYQQII